MATISGFTFPIFSKKRSDSLYATTAYFYRTKKIEKLLDTFLKLQYDFFLNEGVLLPLVLALHDNPVHCPAHHGQDRHASLYLTRIT